MLYLDTSVVVAYYLPEPLSHQAQRILQTQTRPTISELVEVEMFSALSLRVRTGSLSREDALKVSDLFVSHLRAGVYTRLHVRAGHYRRARELIGRFDLPLKAMDALHLAIASTEEVRLLTADQQLGRNASALGIDFDVVNP